MTATSMITLTAPATSAGINELRAAVEKLENEFHGLEAIGDEAGVGDEEKSHDAVELHRRTARDSRSRELLEVLPGGRANGLTPSELAGLMGPDPAGAKLSRGSVRGAIRVVQRVATKLTEEGVISGPVLEIDFSRYDSEKAGRYFVSEEARTALDEYLETA